MDADRVNDDDQFEVPDGYDGLEGDEKAYRDYAKLGDDDSATSRDRAKEADGSAAGKVGRTRKSLTYNSEPLILDFEYIEHLASHLDEDRPVYVDCLSKEFGKRSPKILGYMHTMWVQVYVVAAGWGNGHLNRWRKLVFDGWDEDFTDEREQLAIRKTNEVMDWLREEGFRVQCAAFAGSLVDIKSPQQLIVPGNGFDE